MSGATRALTDARSADDVEQQLVARAQAWLPRWQFDEIPGDFGRALIYIAARMYGRAIDALARTPEKNQRGLLWWLGIGPAPPQAASMPVFFQLAPQADAVIAPQGTRLQASLAQPTIFETLSAVWVVPGSIGAVVGVNPTTDQYFLASTGFPAAGQPAAAQTQWTTLASVAFPPTVLQLSSVNGLASGQILSITGRQFRITALQSNVVTLSAPGPADPTAPAAPGSLPAGTVVELLDVFAPFASTALPTQEHSLLLGDDTLLNLTGSATIDVLLGSGTLPDTVSWSYWGGQTPGWQPLTASSSTPDIVTLTKSAGASTPAQFGGISTYCLRATLSGASSGTVELSSIMLRVRSGTEAVPTPCASASPCPDPSKTPATFLKYNAMWNNTPLVTSPGFLPLGPMPRLFDAFYVGCAEAFGKAGAFVTLCFDAASPSVGALGAFRSGAMLFGVGNDTRLQRLQLDSAAGTVQYLQATQPKESNVAAGASTGNPIALRAFSTPPPVIESAPHTASVLVCSWHRIWMWTEPRGGAGYWTPLGESFTPIEGLVALRAPRGVRVVALIEGRLRSFDLQPDRPPFSVQWEDLPEVVAGGSQERIRTIAAVCTATEDFSDALVAVSERGRLWHFGSGVWHSVDAFADTLDPAVAPLAVTQGRQIAYIVKSRAREQLAAWRSGADAAPVYVRCELQSGLGALRAAPVPRARSVEDVVAEFTVLMLTRPGGEAPRISWWRPFNEAEREFLFFQRPPAGPRPLAGTPAALGEWVVTAGLDAELFVSRLQPAAHGNVLARDISSAALVPAGGRELRSGELLARAPSDNLRIVSQVEDSVRQDDGSFIARLDGRVSRPDSVTAFRLLDISAPSAAKLERATSIILETGGAAIRRGDTLMLGRLHEAVITDARLYDVVQLEERSDGIHVTLDREPHLSDDLRVWVVTQAETIPAIVRPAILVSALPASAAHEDTTLVDGALYAADSDPERLEVTLRVASAEPFVVLAANWKRLPKQKLVFDVVLLRPHNVVASTSDSPQLQWEYWNGSGWTPIPGIDDDPVDELMQSGTVTFSAPSDLMTTSVGGKQDAWIRARLVSGNYGLESYQVTATTSGSTTTYTAVPDDSSVNPPVLNSIDISYRLCQAHAPEYVVSYDNGSYDDQSDANRAGASAVVNAFVPLFEALDAAAAAPSARAPAATATCGCGCPDKGSNSASTPADAGASTNSAASVALYVGFDQPIDPGITISLLWEVNEEDFSAVLPLQVAGVGPSGQMIAFTSGDYTRALGETQVLDIDVSVSLPQINLFGQSLYWLRLQPARSGSWSPQILGVYLNGVWTAAQQTQQMETLGSSTGAPSAQYSLLSLPILDGTLELRVGESLSDADLAALMLGNPGRVLIDPGNLSGDWVLWQQVPDLGTCQPTDRVYTLDEVAGLITFGDGIHGMVPPVGQSNIIAFQYMSGGGAAANDFQPWGSLSLVSPVQGVSTVLAPEAAAGGADATPIGSLLTAAPAMIAQRGRAVTPYDLEQLALQSSPAIAQARCWQAGGNLRLVTMVTGDDVAPSLAQLRALNAYLEARMAPSLAAALTVVAPRLVFTRVTVSGNVTSFDAAAQVSSDVESALDELFDPEIGGVDGAGWPLGRAPMSDDIVAVLNAIENLTAIVSVTLEQIDAQGNASPMPANFDPDQFPVLGDSGVQFNVMAAAA
jgi:predicted phage baseplate assembly protein